MEVTLRIINFEKHLPRKDLIHTHWIKFDIDFLTHPDFFDITPAELKVFIYFVFVAGKVQKDVIRMNIEHTAHHMKVKNAEVLSTIKKLEGKRLESLDEHGRVRILEGNSELPSRVEENRIEKNRIYIPQIEKIYSDLYPRKIGKSDGIKAAARQILSEKDLQDFEAAVKNYAGYCQKNKTEETYIKYFSTFVSEWRDWITVQSAHAKQVSVWYEGAMKILEEAEKVKDPSKLAKIIGDQAFGIFESAGGYALFRGDDSDRLKLAASLRKANVIVSR